MSATIEIGRIERLRRDISAPLVSALPVWGLIGYGLLYAIGMILILPAPWTSTIFLRFFCRHVVLPDASRLRFTGRPGDVWYVLALLAIFGWLDSPAGDHPHYLLHPATYLSISLALAALQAAMWFYAFRWVIAKLAVDHGPLRLRFGGTLGTFIGWNLLCYLSIITIIGWAWALKYAFRWTCEHIEGEFTFRFTAGGWDILWRSLVFGVACLLLIPIPWALRWYVGWWVSTISAQPR